MHKTPEQTDECFHNQLDYYVTFLLVDFEHIYITNLIFNWTLAKLYLFQPLIIFISTINYVFLNNSTMWRWENQ